MGTGPRWQWRGGTGKALRRNRRQNSWCRRRREAEGIDTPSASLTPTLPFIYPLHRDLAVLHDHLAVSFDGGSEQRNAPAAWSRPVRAPELLVWSKADLHHAGCVLELRSIARDMVELHRWVEPDGNVTETA